MSFTYRTQQARPDWSEEGLPQSREYGDVYYSRADALGESTHVFLAGNHLQQRFCKPDSDRFIIGELGFGAGLNFLNTCRLWCEIAPVTAHLHYLACELHPFSRDDLRRVHAHFPGFAKLSAQLLTLYPVHTAGMHQLELTASEHKISLTLLHADALQLLHLVGNTAQWRVDAWFLDGFSPKQNPVMWQAGLLQQVAALSHAGTTLTTYSVAGQVRRDLATAGFSCEKVEGFAGKRHMLRAWLPTHAAASTFRQFRNAADNTVCIVGAGLAGCSTAHALASSGWQVILLDQENSLASQASGNPQGVLHFKPATVDSPDNRFNLHSFLHASRHYQGLQLPATLWSHCGMLQLAHDHKLLKRFRTLAASGMYPMEVVQVLSAAEASELAGLELERPALYFPDAGWLAPPQLCEWYTRHHGITVITGREVSRLEQDHKGWNICLQATDREEQLHCPQVILCNGAQVHNFVQTRHLPVICNRGLVDIYEGNTTSTPDVNMVLCGQGYIIPASEGLQTIGGSFFIEGDSSGQRESMRRFHLEQLSGINKALVETVSKQPLLQQRSGIRCTMADRMPVVGAVDAQQYPGLWVNVAHGSQGLARTPVCAALLASSLNATPAPLAQDVVNAINPQRYQDQRNGLL